MRGPGLLALGLISTVAVLAGLFGALPAADLAAEPPLRVLATLPDLWSITRSIVGDLGRVDVATRPGQNPHDLEIRPSQILLVKRAEILVRNGLEEDAWIDPVVESSGNPRLLRGSTSVIEAAQGLALLKIPSGRVDRSLGDVHPSGNPHFTLDPGTMPTISASIADGLARLRPDLASRLEANRREFLARVESRFQRWRDVLAPYRGARVVSYHDSWPYFYRAYGLIELGVIEDRPGVPPTPQHLVSLVRQMKEQGARVVVLESWYPPDTAAAVARLAGAKLVVIPQSPGAVPGTGDYIAHMEHVVTALAKALADP
jgi:ABC-type Zn uptake system ZnuABC Zn-binding protein ZnuA